MMKEFTIVFVLYFLIVGIFSCATNNSLPIAVLLMAGITYEIVLLLFWSVGGEK